MLSAKESSMRVDRADPKTCNAMSRLFNDDDEEIERRLEALGHNT